MVQKNNLIIQCTERILSSRMRILSKHGFYGLLLMNMKFAVDQKTETAYTDGTKIVFGIDFLNDLSDDELDFIMMHELMHVVLNHCFRGNDYDDELFNIACDIVVNSNILLDNNMDLRSITVAKYGESMHIAPDNNEGHMYTAEQVYEILIKKVKPKTKQKSSEPDDDSSVIWDNHSQWGENDDAQNEWNQRVVAASEAIQHRNQGNGTGNIPLLIQRLVETLKNPQIDWRTILINFIQEDINDYSFFPPDHRYEDSPFFLPDFNEKDESVRNILFMIDTSGSMSSNDITYAYSEIYGAITQFNGNLSGLLGFFDCDIIPPVPFESTADLSKIAPKGGGGTDFHIIFKYIKENMQDDLPAMIIILTDGYAEFPKESEAMGIPVLWLLNNKHVTPPWGKIARIKT